MITLHSFNTVGWVPKMASGP